MGQNKEERGMKVGWILLVKFYLTPEIISRIIEGIDFIRPKGFLIEGVEPQGETDEEAEDQHKNFISF